MYIKFHSTDQVSSDLATASLETNTSSWLLCLADQHGEELDELLEKCRRFGLKVCGGIFPGLIHGNQAKDNGIIARPLPNDSKIISAEMVIDDILWDTRLPPVWDIDGYSSILFMDSNSPNISGVLEDLYNCYGRMLNHHGAGCGYHDLRPSPSVFNQSGLLDHGALLVLINNRSTVCARHGWERVAGPFVASRTDGNIIKELNWESAGSYYQKLVLEQHPEFSEKPIFPEISSVSPLCIAKEGSEDVVRDPMSINDKGEITVLSDVAENSIMYLAKGDHESLITAARQAVHGCGAPNDVEHCFISDCYSRVMMLDDRFPEELNAISSALSEFTDIEPEGVFALGEIANNGYSFLELFNKTVVVALTHHRNNG